MISETTVDKSGKKTVTLKTTGHEKSRLSVVLAAKADGAKREVAALNEEFKGRAVVATSANVCMDCELTIVWINSVLGSFSFNRRLLAWDSLSLGHSYSIVGC